MTTRLLILTKHFPYNMGETAAESYLETEIGYLAEAFDEVIVAATEAPAGRAPAQALPANARSVSLGNVQTGAEKAACLAVGTAARGLLALDAIHSERGLAPKEAVFRRYFVGKAARKWARLVPVLEREGFVPTHAYSFWFYDTALLAAWAKQSYQCTCATARAHRYDLYRDRNGAHFLPCRDYLLGKLDAVLPCSEDGAETLRHEWPAYATKVRRAYLGTRDLPDRSAEPKGDPFEVVTCSRAVPVKRLSLVAEAMTLLDTQGARIRWTHYGNGPDLAAVRERAVGFRVVEARFPGNVPNSELLAEYERRHMDLFVNVSSSEGLPISIMEASGHGVPILATDVGGTSEIVCDGVNGTLVPENIEAKELAMEIGRFYGMSEGELAVYRRDARRAWAESFQTKDNVGILLDVLLGEVG